MKTGKFIVFEGVDGSGKSTQISMLSDRLIAQGVDVVVTKEPGGSSLGSKLRDIMLHGDSRLPIKGELLLMLAERVCHLHDVVIPALDQGKVVLCDRYDLSTLVYQAIVGGLGVSMVDQLNSWVVGDVAVDRYIICDVDDHIADHRVSQRGQPDSIERDRNGDLLARAYRAVWETRDNCVLLPKGGTIEQWHQIVYDIVNRVALKI